MAPEDIPSALTPFGQVGASLTTKHEGAGLGLPLVKSFVGLHGGWIDIQSARGKGTTVTVFFPSERVMEGVESAPVRETDLLPAE